jgi:CBS-domain-containing membrane protein
MLIATQGPLQRLEELLVADVMTREVAALSAAATMEEAAKLLKSHGISGAPVVDNEGRCIGVLSAVDFLQFDQRNAALGYSGPERAGVGRRQPPWNSVQRYMTAPAHTVLATAHMLLAADLMCTKHVHRLIVLDDRDTPVGLVSTLDIVSAMVHAVDENRQGSRQHERRN